MGPRVRKDCQRWRSNGPRVVLPVNLQMSEHGQHVNRGSRPDLLSHPPPRVEEPVVPVAELGPGAGPSFTCPTEKQLISHLGRSLSRAVRISTRTLFPAASASSSLRQRP